MAIAHGLPLKAKVIFVIADGEHHAYEACKLIQDAFPKQRVQFHSVYSAIRRAEEEGLLRSSEKIASNENRRLRFYELSAQGKLYRNQMLQESSQMLQSSIPEGILPKGFPGFPVPAFD
jgi:DNA-binding PadR family transcriptional regulator